MHQQIKLRLTLCEYFALNFKNQQQLNFDFDIFALLKLFTVIRIQIVLEKAFSRFMANKENLQT